MDIPKNTLISCSRKGHAIGYTAEPLKAGNPLKLSAVRFAADQYRVQGEPFACRRCGSLYAMNGHVHTVQGWLPDDPVMEPPVKHKTFERGQVKARANPDTIEKAQAKDLKKVLKGKAEKKVKDKVKP